MSEDATLALVLPEYGGFDLQNAVSALAAATGRNVHDLRRALRVSPGLPCERLTASAAAAALAALLAIGIDAQIVDADMAPLLPRPQRVTGARFAEDALYLARPGGGETAIPWSGESLLLLSAAAFIENTDESFEENEDPAERRERIKSGGDVVATIAEIARRGHEWDLSEGAADLVREYLGSAEGIPGKRIVLLADFCLRAGEVLRIKSEAFEYRCLGCDVASSTFLNMSLLLDRLDTRFAASAPRGMTWRDAASGDLASATFASEESLARWLRWRLIGARRA